MPAPLFNIGDEVRLKSRPDRVGKITGSPFLSAGEYWYPIYSGPGRAGRYPESDLEITAISADVRDLFRSGRFASRDALSKLYTHLRLVTSIRSQIYALNASRTHFYAYQFKPLLKFLDSRNHRLLIADEVGLGKTIETGLVLREFKKRKDLKRILVVPPAHLLTKWQIEMRNRFDLDFEVLDRRRAFEFLKRYDEEGDETILNGILSLQTLRSQALMDEWESVAPNLDIVIFDEAGRLRNSETRSHKLASILIENSDSALLLTATPVQTGDEDLFNLLRLLDPEEFDSYELFQLRLQANMPVIEALRHLRLTNDGTRKCYNTLRQVENSLLSKRFLENPIYKDILDRLESIKNPSISELIDIQRDINSLNVFSHIINRTRKREVHENRPMRCAFVIPVEPTADEVLFYRLVTDLCSKEYTRKTGDIFATFVATTRQRQVASCMVAMLDYYKDKFNTLLEEIEISDLRLEDFDLNPEDVETGRIKEIDSISNFDAWEKRLSEKDSKWEKFFELITNLEREEPGRKIVLFSYYKKTLAYLKRKLHEKNILCELISGDIPSDPDNPENDERGKRIDNFKNNPSIRILLSTEVGSEGIDLQFAHILINYDLPWNPMVVEQRIGRLDRIGQKSDRILIFNLSIKGTIEERILSRLYHRIGIFEKSIGDLEAILGEVINQMTKDLFTRHLSQEEQESRIEEAAEVIIRKQKELEEFEEAASAFMGHDEYYMDEINRAKDNRRYVGGEELILYLRDFLREHYRACQLEDTDRSGVYLLSVNNELRAFVRNKIPSHDLGLRLFLNRSTSGTIKLTINNDLAQEDRKIEYLTFHHPLIRAITSYYDLNPSELHPVSHTRLNTSAYPAGIYAWFLYLLEITGARPLKDINVVVMPIRDLRPLSEEDSEKLFSEFTLNGILVPPGERGISDLPSDDLISIAEDTFITRLNKKLEQLRRSNDALVSKRLASLEESFLRNLKRKEELLEKSKLQKRKQSYIKGLETGIRNMKSRYEANRSAIESMRNIGKGYDLKGSGIVEISNG